MVQGQRLAAVHCSPRRRGARGVPETLPIRRGARLPCQIGRRRAAAVSAALHHRSALNSRAATLALGTVPESLRGQVSRWWERACELPVLMAAHQALPATLRDEMPRVVAASEFIAAALLQDPEALAWLDRNHDPSMTAAVAAEYPRQASAAATTADA